jgi:hypothetical protein
MNDRRPPPSSVGVLSDEQESVLACMEAGLGEDATSESTGLPPERVAAVVRDLIDLRVIAEERGALVSPSSEDGELAEPGSTLELEEAEDADDAPDFEDAEGELPEGIEPWSGEEMPQGTTSGHDQLAPAQAVDPGSISSLPPRRSRPPTSRPPPVDEVNFRRIYETRFSELTLGEREDVALHVHGNELFALCLDPAPQVIAALLENAHFGLDHARLVALHHKTPQGLEILARRAQLVRDNHVQRRMLQNLQTPEAVLDRILRYKRLIDVYRLSIDRDLPERNRLRVRARLRPRFMNSEPEERAALVIKTEGRCLLGLGGCSFDGRTTQILCNHSYTSTLFIQNLARFAGTPPVLLAKLLRSGPAQRQPQLRALLLRHANVSGEWKRKG